MRISSLIAIGIFLVQAASARLPILPGYSTAALDHNLTLPVEVIGEGISEQASPVMVYLPTSTVGSIEGAKNASSLPGLPKIKHGHRLVVLPYAYESPLYLRDGRTRQANLPLFAYVPSDPSANSAALIEDFAKASPVVVAPIEEEAPFAAPAKANTISVSLSEIEAPASIGSDQAPGLAEAIQNQPALPPEPSPKPIVHVAAGTDPAPVKPVLALAATSSASSSMPENDDVLTWDQVLGDSNSFKDTISVGQIILDDRQQLRNRMPVRVEFVDKPLSEVVLSLARTSKIDFTLGALPPGDPHVTTRFRAAPFAALEQIARQHGVGLYKEDNDPLWSIRKIDPDVLIAKTYKLKEIHLGKSSGASGDEVFGAGLDNFSSSGTASSSSRNNTGSSSSGLRSNAASGSSTGSNSTGFSGNSAGAGDRFDEPSSVLFTIKSILGLIESAPMTSELNPVAEGENGGTGQRLTTQPTASSGNNRVNGLVSWDAESSSIFVLGNYKQHQWVEEYLKLVDRPAVEIAIDAMFVESDSSPSEKLGVDWSQTMVDWNIGTGDFNLGTLGKPLLPSGALLSSEGVRASLNAFITESKARMARYPRVVTHNNKEVRLATTVNVPIITQASTVAGAVPIGNTTGSTPGAGESSGTIQTNFTSGTQEIGTIITILPSRIGDDKVHVKLTIEISSGESPTAGETLTGRIPTTSTVYEGEVVIPTGRTLAIGGLERIAETSGIGRVPGISKVPVFGFLFKKKEDTFQNTNLTLFLTPRILDLNNLPTAPTRQEKSANIAMDDSLELEQAATAKKPKSDKRK